MPMKNLWILFVFVSYWADCQDKWSLEKCINYAIENNITIQQSDINVRNAEIDLSQAKQSRYPNLNGNISANSNFGRSIDPTTNEFNSETFLSNNFGFNSNVLLWNGGVIKNSIKQSELNVEAANNDIEQVRRNTALQVATNFLNILFAKENISISERQLALSQQQLSQLNKFIAAGARPEAERLNLEAQIAQSEQDLISAKNNLDIAILNLKQSLNLEPNYELDLAIPEGLVATTDPDLITFDEAFEMAQNNRPDLVATELRQESAEIGVDIAKAAFYPTLSLSGSLGTTYSNRGRIVDFFQTQVVDQSVSITSNNPALPLNNVPIIISSQAMVPVFKDQGYVNQLDGNLSYGLGLNLSVPIYNRGTTKSNVERAQLNSINNQLNREQLLQGLKTTVQQSIADARAAKKRVEASTKTVQAQKLAFENTSRRLELGAANSFEWESQKTNLENAEINALIDKYNYLFAIKTLEFYLGKTLKL
jgi:outer membrane protein